MTIPRGSVYRTNQEPGQGKALSQWQLCKPSRPPYLGDAVIGLSPVKTQAAQQGGGKAGSEAP